MGLSQTILKYVWNCAGSADEKRLAKQTPVEGVCQHLNVSYADDRETAHFLDIYYPKKAETPLPIIVNIHGGGWMYGSKELNTNYCKTFSKKGFVVFNINYRLAPEFHFDHQMRDVFSALGWISKNAPAYHGDLKNVFLMGESAGGHLAAMIAAVHGDAALEKVYGAESFNTKISAVGLVSPVIDLVSFNPMMNINLPVILGKKYRKSPLYRYITFSDVYKGGTLPPFYLVSSSGDILARGQTKKLDRILTKHNIQHKFHFWGKYKGKSLPHVFCVMFYEDAPGKLTIEEMTDFFRKYMI